jgi:hypothetical protein
MGHRARGIKSADIAARQFDVRFTPESGHQCPLSATSGHLAGMVADNKRPPGGHEQLPKSPITIERPTNNDCADDCPEYVEPSVRVAISEAEQRTKYSGE